MKEKLVRIGAALMTLFTGMAFFWIPYGFCRLLFWLSYGPNYWKNLNVLTIWIIGALCIVLIVVIFFSVKGLYENWKEIIAPGIKIVWRK